MEICLLIIGCVLAFLFILWLAFGRKISSKAVTLFIDTGLIALCIAVIACGLCLRREKYKKEKEKQQEQTLQMEKSEEDIIWTK